MTKKIPLLLLLLACGTDAYGAMPHPKPVPPKAAPVVVGPTVPTEHSHFAILVDAATGQVLWARNPDAKRAIASTTKIMTATLLLERGHLDDTVIAPKGVDKIEESSLHLTPGEKISLHDLLYAMLLRSANDTAVAGADYLSGSVPAFVALMNAKAKEIGATHTHFVTPNGLYNKDHYSTAGDLAKITCYAVNNAPEFNEIVRTEKYRVNRSMHTGDVWVKNTADTFLKTFPGADGIKTGYVREAGHCFVGSATRGGWRLIAVALDSNSCREDVMSLLNYGFANFQPLVAIPKDAPEGTITVSGAAALVPVTAASDVRIIISKWKPAPVFQTHVTPLAVLPSAPIAVGTKLGVVSVIVDGKTLASGDVVAGQSIALSPVVGVLRTTEHVGLTLLKMVGVVLGVGIVLLGGMALYAGTVAKSTRRRRDRLASNVRGVDQARPGSGGRAGRDRTRYPSRPKHRPGDI